MKNVFLGLIFMLVLVPQVSFGAVSSDPQMIAFIKQQDSDSVAFFQQQATDRAAFMKAHADIIAKLDQQGKALMRQKYAQSHPGQWTDNKDRVPPTPLSGDDQNTYSAFIQKQLNEKQAFLAKQAQDKQSFLNSQPGA